jgi:hypothetical protein
VKTPTRRIGLDPRLSNLRLKWRMRREMKSRRSSIGKSKERKEGNQLLAQKEIISLNRIQVKTKRKRTIKTSLTKTVLRSLT